MHRSREARLGRLVEKVQRAERAAAEERLVLRARAAIGDAVRVWLAEAGIDPASAAMLRVADWAATELAAAEPAPQEREPPREGALWLDDDTRRLVERYRSGELPDPDPAQASLAELFAWCIARKAQTGVIDRGPFAVDLL